MIKNTIADLLAKDSERMPVPSRVIHVVENLDRGAVENWLVRMLLHASRSGIALNWTFYCSLGKPGRLDEVARQAGANVILSPVPIGKKWHFIRALRSELCRGQYDVLHCHHDLISGIYLVAAAGLPIRTRIVHIHNADEAVLTSHRIKQRLLRPMLRGICLQLANRIVGISNHTLDTFLAGRPRQTHRDLVHYYGIDPKAFAGLDGNRSAFRRRLGLLDNSLILLFAGRVVPEKNPLFVVEVLLHLKTLEPRAVAVFAGSGSLEEAVYRRSEELGLQDSIRMLGFRNDIPAIMRASDLFILPRPEQPMEGFGIAVVEAQLAGLRLLLSKGIPDDPLLPGACYERLAIAAGPASWAAAAVRLINLNPLYNTEAAAILADSHFDLDFALRDLLSLYESD